MRVAGQEGLGGSAQETTAIKAAGVGAASAGGAFFALLALLQNGGVAGEVAATPDAAGTIDVEDGEPADAHADDATAGSAGEGVVVTLSVAANTSALATVAASAATTTKQPQGSPAGGAAIATLVAGGGEGTHAASGGKAVAAFAARLAQGSGSAPQIATDPAAQVATNGAAATGAAAAGDTATGGAATVATATQLAESAEGAFSRAARGALAQARPAAAGHTPDGARTGAEHAAQGSANATQSAPAAPATSPATTAQALASATAAGEAAVGSEQESAPESVRGGARRAAAAARFAAHDAEGEAESTSDAADDDTGFGSPRGTTGGVATRELPAGVRVLSDPLQLRAGLEHGAQNTDARPEALVAARAEASSATNASNGTTRLRAAGFSNGEASLPSWVERLASPEGLAATRRGNTLHIDLEPNGLGRIELRLSFGRDGVRASVLTEHEHTRTLLASQQPQLAAALDRSDLRLESFLVDVGAQSGGDGREAWRDATDPAAFDQIGLVHTTSAEPVVDESATLGRGLVNVRA